MATSYGRVSSTKIQLPPIVAELQAVFDALPDDELLEALRGPRRRGRRGYEPKVLWRCFVAYYVLGLPSVSDLIRLLYDNPYIAAVCDIESPEGIPSQPTFSRFLTKLSKRNIKGLVRQVSHKLVRRFYETKPGFGKSVAMDATDLKAWSNGAHSRPTDKDAGWVVKKDTNGRGKFTWGYKLSLLVDTQYELPMAVKVTKGNVHDLKSASVLLSQARWANSKFHPEYVIADTAYSSDAFRKLVRRQYRAQPIVKTHPLHKKALKANPETPAWQLIYNRRTAVERVFGRLKGHRKLNYIRARGLPRVTVHCLLSVIALQAQALATGNRCLARKAGNTD